MVELQISKKGLVAIILACMVAGSIVAYALIETQWIVQNHIKILGGALELWQWEEGETYSLTYEVDDFGGMIPGTSIESPFLVLAVGSETSINQVLSYDTTLPTDVGYIRWQVEVFIESGGTFWKWYNWTESAIQAGPFTTIYLPGTPNNPIEPLEKIGLRPSTPVTGDIGHFKYTLYTYETAPCADYDFDIIIKGTEV